MANEPSKNDHVKGAYEYFKPLIGLTRELNPQKRPVTIIYHDGKPDTDLVEELDVLY